MGIQTAVLTGIIGKAFRVCGVSNLPCLIRQSADCIIVLPGTHDRCAVVPPLAGDQTVVGIVTVDVFGSNTIFCSGNTVEVAFAGVCVAQHQSTGVGSGLDPVQFVIGIGYGTAVAGGSLFLVGAMESEDSMAISLF